MSAKQNLVAMIAVLLLSIMAASMNTANTATPSTNTLSSGSITPMASTTPPANNTISEARDQISVYCNVNNFGHSYLSNYDEVVGHIRSMPGNATLGNKPGGGWCFRYSCSENLGIYGCNDNQADTQVPWATMAKYADDIKEKCKKKKRVHGRYKDIVLGQAFDSDGWNVILGLESGSTC